MRAEEFLGISILFVYWVFLIYSLTRLWYLALIGIVLAIKSQIFMWEMLKNRE